MIKKHNFQKKIKNEFFPRQKFVKVWFSMCFVMEKHHAFVFSLRLCMRPKAWVTLDLLLVELVRISIAKIARKPSKKHKKHDFQKNLKVNFFPSWKFVKVLFSMCFLLEKHHSFVFFSSPLHAPEVVSYFGFTFCRVREDHYSQNGMSNCKKW